MKYILVTGSRDWTDFDTISTELKLISEKFPVDDTYLVHGNARGADKISAYLWKKMGGKDIALSAEWDKYGKAAGPIRNKDMLDNYDISHALAFSKNESKGTSHMIFLLEERKIPVKISTSSDAAFQFPKGT